MSLHFAESEKGLGKEEAIAEAKRCLQCENPKCIEACPAGIDCRAFIKQLADDNVEKAGATIREKNQFPCITGRCCPAEMHCEKACVLNHGQRPVAIRKLERFAADNSKEELNIGKRNGYKIAVVGSGPAGLAVALEMRRQGAKVRVYEGNGALGGMLAYIPEFRLPKKVLQQEIERMKEAGIKFENCTVGKDLMLRELQQRNGAVFLGIGQGGARKIGLPAENLRGVLYWDEFLANGHALKMQNKRVVVIGGGDTAMDCARLAARHDADVTVASKEHEAALPCQKKEIVDARKEGVRFEFALTPERFVGNGAGLEAIAFDRKRLDAEFAIIAIGQQADNGALNGTLLQHKGIKGNSSCIILPGLFAAGDCCNEQKTIVHAIAGARQAVAAIIEFLDGEK